MRWLCRRLCGMHPARVIHGSGQVLYFSPRTTVEEVLRYHPHHFLCQPGLNIYSGWSSNQMLAMDTELQSGCVYFLLPLPRLFPAAPNPSSQSCRCYQSQNVLSQTPNRVLKHIQSPTCRSSFIFYGSPRRVEGLQSPFRSSAKGMWCFRSCCKNSKSNKISPESNLYGGTDILTSTPLYLPWRPRLGCISEEDDVAVSLEDVKRYCRKLWRKDHQAVNQLSSPNRSPATSPFN
ncbi:hypothetical protein KC19_12G016700 [Ceratodon purpureus]|uniref:Uncharacterized protein n=1 Tax=Ceratodon purpureus TaxID=3225 RepID=A0A8T0G3L9_CERPU|nr:hypothetical protein KC19_12G016700 [Ceratodon purpureus]